MKKYFYIGLFMLLGLLLSQILHAGLEIPALGIIERDLAETGESWLLSYWWLLHDIGGIILAVAGLAFGLVLGKKCWRIIYVEHRRGIPKW